MMMAPTSLIGGRTTTHCALFLLIVAFQLDIIPSLVVGPEYAVCKQQWNKPMSNKPTPIQQGSRQKTTRNYSCNEDFLDSLQTHADWEEHMSLLQDDPLVEEGGRLVLYRGNPRATLMIVGEAPGAKEDELGLPFVGRAGQLLDAMLCEAGWDVEREVYVSNLVRRRPPGNRDPTAEEVAYYAPLLRREVELVNPRIVLATGRFSMRALLGEGRGITKVRGRWYEDTLPGRACMPIFHPSYLLRNPSKTKDGPRWLTWQDILEVRRRYESMMIEPSSG